MPSTLLTEIQFNILIHQVDDDLQRNDTPVPARPFMAIRDFSQKLNTKITHSYKGSATKGVYTDETLAFHIHEWYGKRYGKKLYIDMRINNIAIMIRGVLWRLHLPKIWGQVIVTCSKSTFNKIDYTKVSKTTPPILNVLDLIDDITEDFVLSLTPREISSIYNFYTTAHNNLSQLEFILDKQFVSEAKCDFKIAVDTLLQYSNNFGMPKWSSLQFVEKLLKAYMVESGIKFDKHHNLFKHNDRAKSCGHFMGVPEHVLAKIQCNASVRYDMSSITLLEAYESHLASIEACLCLANPIRMIKMLINKYL